VIDLKAQYGATYRITLDPSAEGEPLVERPWYHRISCRYGFISRHGEDTLTAWTDRRQIIPRLISLEGVQVHQRGDREVRVLFTPNHLDVVADLLQAHRRKQISDQERQRLAEMSRQYSPFRIAGGELGGPGRDLGPREVSQDVPPAREVVGGPIDG
jgi:hypothetical protein